MDADILVPAGGSKGALTGGRRRPLAAGRTGNTDTTRRRRCQATSRSKHSCHRCRNYIRCNEACIYVEEILKREESSFEATLQYEDERLTKDYNEVLVEIREALVGHNKINISKIRQIKDIKLRAIAVMLYARVPVVEIAELFRKSRSQIYRYIQKGQW
ncbi:MAG: hypothetical protein SFH39_15555 [Candidatus Magnetobacterium sp. LHC-1]